MTYDFKFGAFIKQIVVCEYVTIKKGKESGNGPRWVES
jgi:hypothetical protein